MKVLVINAGSSSIKYQLLTPENGEVISQGLAERIGEEQGAIKHYAKLKGEDKKLTLEHPIKDHKQGLEEIAKLLTDEEIGVIDDVLEIEACGHRIVHGGEAFSKSVLIDQKVIQAIEDCVPLAPLHNPANLSGITVAREIFTKAKHVAVFDTAFHQTMPPHAYHYAIPDELYTGLHIRRYGFHGTSHLYVSKEAAKFVGKEYSDCNCITVHIGNGCSIAAIRGGKSVDTSMGLTPLEGLIMGTRSGDIDPAITGFLAANRNMNYQEIDALLNKGSGLKGLAGSNDMRDVEARYKDMGDEKATLALDMYCYRIKKYIGAYFAVLGTVDALVFTAGVGENSTIVRQKSVEGLENMGICIDKARNEAKEREIREVNKEESKLKILVIPTNEELEIANQTIQVINNPKA